MNQNQQSATPFLLSIVGIIVALVALLFGHGGSDTQTLAQVQTLQNAVQQVIATQSAQAQAQPGTRVGSLSGPEIPSPYLQWGSINHWAAAGSPVATTTTGVFCVIPLPYGTTSIDRASWNPNNVGAAGVSATATFDISTSTLVSGSSTPALIAAAPISSTVIWGPEASSSIGDQTRVLNVVNTAGNSAVFTTFSSPSAPMYLTFRIATTSGNTGVIPSAFTGTCEYEGTQL